MIGRSADDGEPGADAPWGRHVAEALRPVLLVVVAGGVAVVGAGGEPATSLLLEYRMRALAVALVGVGAVGYRLGVRRSRPSWFQLVPAAAGAIAAMTLIGSLAGTPYGPGGLGGDQTFRTAAVTRYADTWHNVDFASRGLPSFYPPAYFWVLGRIAGVIAVEPWHMLKVGAIAAALTVPMVAFVLWRRVVSERIAALVSVVAIAVENFYEPYSWLVIAAFVPWWLEVVHGARRAGQPQGRPLLLGAVGALMIMTYWYFFAVGVIAFAIKLVVDRFGGGIDRDELRHTARVAVVAVVVSGVYWLPLVLSVVRADHPESLGNRWFNTSHPRLPLPMFDVAATGVVAFVGVVYLAWAFRTVVVARGLAVLVMAAYAWYLIGAAAAAAGHPLLSFRVKPLIPMVLLIAGVIALVQLVEFAVDRWDNADLARVGITVGCLFGVYVANGFINDVRDSPYIEAARSATRPDDSPPEPSAIELRRLIESRVGEHPVLLSDRVDVIALSPSYTFVIWNAHYAHPASEFSKRIEFLVQLSDTDDPASFRALAEQNPYDTIDAFVLLDDSDDLVFRYGADAFPAGTRGSEIRFPKELFAEFDQVRIGDHILAVPD